MQALLDAIAAMPVATDACRIFHGRGGLHPGCEQWVLDVYPPVFVLTSFAPATEEALDAIGAALQARIVGGELGPLKYLRRTLDKVDARIHTAVKLIMLFWLVSGFMTAMALMHADAVNFFYVLVSVLGINWLMLLLWLFWLLMSKGQSARKQGAWFNPLSFIRSKDTLTQSAVDVYEAHLHQPNMRWFWGKVSHQFWLATLTGLFAGITLMLTIRQYTFNWQSTLLDSHMLAKLVGWLSWLPNKLGISTVDAQTVAHNQTVGQIADARQWAILLMLSLLLYGIVPRVIAWLICHLRLSTKSPDLPLALPYYQRLQRLWTPAHVIDADTMREQIGTQIHQCVPTAYGFLLCFAEGSVLRLVVR